MVDFEEKLVFTLESFIMRKQGNLVATSRHGSRTEFRASSRTLPQKISRRKSSRSSIG